MSIQFHRHHCSNGRIRAFIAYARHDDQTITLAAADQDSGANLRRMFPDYFLPEIDLQEYGWGTVTLTQADTEYYELAWGRARLNEFENASAAAIDRDFRDTAP